MDEVPPSVDRLPRPPRLVQRRGPLRVRRRQRRIERARGLGVRDGPLRLPDLPQRAREVSVNAGNRIVDRHRPRHQLDGGGVVTALSRDEPEQLQRVELLRVDRQHLPVQRLGLLKPPRLVVVERQLDRLEDGHLRHAPCSIGEGAGSVIRAAGLTPSPYCERAGVRGCTSKLE